MYDSKLAWLGLIGTSCGLLLTITILSLSSRYFVNLLHTTTKMQEYIVGQTNTSRTSNGGETSTNFSRFILEHVMMCATKKTHDYTVVESGVGRATFLIASAELTGAKANIGVELDYMRCKLAEERTSGFSSITILNRTYVPIPSFPPDKYSVALNGDEIVYMYFNNADGCMLQSQTNDTSRAPQVELEKHIHSDNLLRTLGSMIVCPYPMSLDNRWWKCDLIEIKNIPPKQAFSWYSKDTVALWRYTRVRPHKKVLYRHHLRIPTKTIDYPLSQQPQDDIYFEVDELLDVREGCKGREWKIRWKGYGKDSDSWEPDHNIALNPDLGEYRFLRYHAYSQLTISLNVQNNTFTESEMEKLLRQKTTGLS